jgi:hypothetical protein
MAKTCAQTFLHAVSALSLCLAASSAAGGADAALLTTPDAVRLSLDEIGLYAVGYQYRGQPEQAFPRRLERRF